MNKCEYESVCNAEKEKENETRKLRWTQKPLLRQIAVSSCVGASLFQMGLYIGACPVLIAQLRNQPFADDVAIDDERASWISCIGAFSGIPCVMLLALISEILGRKPAHLFMSIMTCVSFIIFYCATSYKMLIFALILQGPLLGGSSVVCMVIAAECVSPKYRGLIVCLQSATIFWAIWLGNAIGTFFHWKNIGIVGILSTIYNILMIIICPESPFWLASKRKIKKCQDSYRWFRGTDETAESELECLIKSEMKRSPEIEQDQSEYQKLLHYVKKLQAAEFYKPMGLIILLCAMFHLSGKYILSMYAIDIIEKITESKSAAYTGMLILDGITVLGMYIGSVISKYIKRRTLLFTSEFMSIAFLILLSLYLYLIKLDVIEENVYLSISMLLAFSLSISSGAMIVINALLSELLPLELRTLAAVTQCVTTNIMGGISLKIAPWVFSLCGTHGTFLFFGIGSLVVTMLLYKYMPETSDKTLSEIESLFKEKGKSKRDKELLPLAKSACAESGVSPA